MVERRDNGYNKGDAGLGGRHSIRAEADIRYEEDGVSIDSVGQYEA